MSRRGEFAFQPGDVFGDLVGDGQQLLREPARMFRCESPHAPNGAL